MTPNILWSGISNSFRKTICLKPKKFFELLCSKKVPFVLYNYTKHRTYLGAVCEKSLKFIILTHTPLNSVFSNSGFASLLKIWFYSVWQNFIQFWKQFLSHGVSDSRLTDRKTLHAYTTHVSKKCMNLHYLYCLPIVFYCF